MENCDSNMTPETCCCGWMGRNWKWFVPLTLVVCLCVAVGLFAKFVGQGALLEIYRAYRADSAIKASEPFRMAIEQLQADPAVVERLGQGFEISGRASGSISTAGETDARGVDQSAGNANFYFDLRGHKGTAGVACQAKMIDGRWGLSTLRVTFDDDSRHAVDISGDDDGPEEAPRWSP